MGAVYSRTSDGSVLRDLPVDEITGLVDRFFAPYAGALAELVDDRLAVTGAATIVDLHSYPLVPLPYELHAGGPRPEICLGTDSFHTPASLLASARDAFVEATPSGDVGEDSPFAGCYVPLKHYGSSKAVRALMIELRRDLYMDADFGLIDTGASRLAAGVTALIDAIDAGKRS